MKIGVFAANLAVRAGYEGIVSGHLQVALRTAALLADAGHEVHVITSSFSEGAVLPTMLDKRLEIHQVAYRDRGRSRLVHLGSSSSLPGKLGDVQTVWELRQMARRLGLDILHFFGGPGTADLAGLVRSLGVPCAVAVTLYVGKLPLRLKSVRRRLWHRIDLVLTSTEFFRQQLVRWGLSVELLRHGVVHSQAAMNRAESAPRHRVLFWREASPNNGGDIGLEIFRRLAPQYPQFSFDFALRPHPLEPSGVRELAGQLENVNRYETPYPAGVSLAGLLAEAACVVQPFRAFTIQPQFSILESMEAGVAVVASDIESAGEMIESGVDGLLVPVEDVAAVESAVRGLLEDLGEALAIGVRAQAAVARKWGWAGYSECLEGHYRRIR